MQLAVSSDILKNSLSNDDKFFNLLEKVGKPKVPSKKIKWHN